MRVTADALIRSKSATSTAPLRRAGGRGSRLTTRGPRGKSALGNNGGQSVMATTDHNCVAHAPARGRAPGDGLECREGEGPGYTVRACRGDARPAALQLQRAVRSLAREVAAHLWIMESAAPIPLRG